MRKVLLASVLLALFVPAIDGCGGSSPDAAPAATSCGTPYKFVAEGKTVPSGSCAGLLPRRPPALTLRVGQTLALEISHEEDGRLLVPIPTATSTAIHMVGHNGASVTYAARSAGVANLVAHNTRYCIGVDPKPGECAVLVVRVVSGAN